MARSGITFEQVAAAADQLAGEGQSPTIRAVRERLGSGSPNTVHQHLVAWRAARPVAAVAAPELPQALTAAIAAEIERAAAAARGEIEGRLVQTQAEAAELAQAGEALEIERDQLAGQLAAVVTERDILAGRADALAVELATGQARIEREQQAAEAARVDLATARLRIEGHAERLTEQVAEIARLRTALTEALQGRTGAEQQAAVLAARLDAATDRAIRAEQRAAQVEQLRDAAVAERDAERKVAGEAREHAARLAGQLSAHEEHTASLLARITPLATSTT